MESESPSYAAETYGSHVIAAQVRFHIVDERFFAFASVLKAEAVTGRTLELTIAMLSNRFESKDEAIRASLASAKQAVDAGRLDWSAARPYEPL